MDETIRLYKPGISEPIEGTPNEIARIIGTIRGKHQKPEDEPIETVSEDWNTFLKPSIPEVQKDPEPEKKHFIPDNESRIDTLKHSIEENEARIHELNERYPWIQIFTRWICVALSILFIGACVWWGMDISARNKAEAAYNEKVNAFYQEQETKAEANRQAALAAQKSEEALMKENAKWKAKVLYGARNFEDKYGYTKADFLTLCQCIDNRCAFYGMTVEEVVRQEGQWVGYYDSNPGDVDKYYKIALESERTKASQETKPISSDYVYAYYTDRGIYLSNKYGEKNGFGMWRHE